MGEGWIDFNKTMRDKDLENCHRGDIGNGHKRFGQTGKGTFGLLS